MAKEKPPLQEAPTALSSLADVLRARGVQVAESSSAASTPPPAVKPPRDGGPDLSHSGKLVVRRERKGHGGKTVTVIEGLRLSSTQLEMVARTLRKTVGCGSRVENGCVLLQGDLVAAADKWLRAHGATQVVQGN
jgi:translation initiation factor 1